VWQKAMALATEVYRVTEHFPRAETYGLTNQLRRAVVAVPSDIAEGKGRLSKREFIQMLARARGSLFEVVTQIEIGKNLDFVGGAEFAQISKQCAEVGRLLNGLIRAIRHSLRAKS
ncbi:MAG TPA: four helix bundle protein, partial [Thermoanaerobaculia bacterium]|nr:four helix bundle protein [Thermoanaerobaculia bacterium]